MQFLRDNTGRPKLLFINQCNTKLLFMLLHNISCLGSSFFSPKHASHARHEVVLLQEELTEVLIAMDDAELQPDPVMMNGFLIFSFLII